ncbi:MAG: LLM class flavin-dependent oxidoreductase, partial [Rhodococcus sp. (in: high G+C Gram-positive bacteria)]
MHLAQILERGKFDALFFADTHGVYDPYLGSRDKYIETGLGIPNNDPAALISALAYATRDLGFAFTSSILQEQPFNFARKVSTLDHLSKGRIAWNIVTTQFVNSATNFGLPDRPDHDTRYAWADEYVDVA